MRRHRPVVGRQHAAPNGGRSVQRWVKKRMGAHQQHQQTNTQTPSPGCAVSSSKVGRQKDKKIDSLGLTRCKGEMGIRSLSCSLDLAFSNLRIEPGTSRIQETL